MEPMILRDERHQMVTVVFHMDARDYEEAREHIADFLMGAPPDYAMNLGLRAVVVTEYAEADPSEICFCPN